MDEVPHVMWREIHKLLCLVLNVQPPKIVFFLKLCLSVGTLSNKKALLNELKCTQKSCL
jgi:hypothetical protein